VLHSGPNAIAGASGERIVLATSDVRRDGRFLASLSKRLGIPWTACRTVAELVNLVDGSAGIVSDRYHPAICAAALGKASQILLNREPHKMSGLQSLLAEHGLSELQGLARAGLTEIVAALRRSGPAAPHPTSERSA
jgi:polysaccharide pyruvyl transferase WcaK-like protein